jgi:hypothetical protein
VVGVTMRRRMEPVPAFAQTQPTREARPTPSAALARGREPILTAWDAEPALAARFWAGARAALPIAGSSSHEAAFTGVE